MAPTTSVSSAAAARARVLVLDDDVLMCRYLERSLHLHGFTVESETSPQEALGRLGVEAFDVVVSDLNMEGLDGLAFTQRVIGLQLDLPVILVTGTSTMEIAMHAVLAGAWDFLTKPLETKLLVASLRRATEHRQLRQELRELSAQLKASDFTLQP